MVEQISTNHILEITDSKPDLKKLLNSLPENPGIYSYLESNGTPIYIGKAKNLKKRISSYFRVRESRSDKLNKLINSLKYIEITITNTELEALLLEQHLIKEQRPKYNVQFKDDKGYPWIELAMTQEFPSANSFRGKKDEKNKYFGPYPDSYSVRNTLKLIQKIFKVSNCSDSFSRNRSRPCIQYEIGRCSAPCVGYINKDEYMNDVRSVELLLLGKSEELMSGFYGIMDKFSKKKDYEKAALYRDKISALRDIQRTQSISGYSSQRDAISLSVVNGFTKVGVTHVNEGWVTGHENFIQNKEYIEGNIIEEFIKSHYLNKVNCPPFLVIGEPLKDKVLLEEALSKYHQRSIKIITRPSKKDHGLLELSQSNTDYSSRESKAEDRSSAFSSLEKDLDLVSELNLIESYDISHNASSAAVGGYVVFSPNGKLKDKYRLFNISSENSGNDIGSMVEVIERRFKNKNINLENPDLIILDGGKAHLNAVSKKLKELKIKDVFLISISKGVRRKADMDLVHLPNGSTKRIKSGSLTDLFIQEIRDETHRFSIYNQRKRFNKISIGSSLDGLYGVGPKKQKKLMRHFGSVDQIKRASIEDLMKVQGLGRITAVSIYNQLN